MDISNYLAKKTEIQEKLLLFIDDDSDEDKIYKDFIKYFKDPQYQDYIGNHKEILNMINKIAGNHHRSPDFFKKIEKILVDIQDWIKGTFTNLDLYLVFQNNKKVLLLLIQNKILILDATISEKMMHLHYQKRRPRTKNRSYVLEFLYPEVRSFLPKDIDKSVRGQIFHLESIDVKDPSTLSEFEKRREKGENSDYLCTLIREDSVEEFIKHVNRLNINLKSPINHSIFETSSFLSKMKGTTLIEYAAFYGSIQILNYLVINGVEVDPIFLLYAVHSNSADSISIFESKYDEYLLKEKVYQAALNESLNCHHLQLSEYFIDNFLETPNFNESVKSMNFKYFPDELFNLNIFFHLCKYDYYEIVKKFIQTYSYKMNENPFYWSYESFCDISFVKNNLDVVNILRSLWNHPLKGVKFYRRVRLRNNVDYQEVLSELPQTYPTRTLLVNGIHVDEFDFTSMYLERGKFLKVLHIPNFMGKIQPNVFHKCPYIRQIIFDKPSLLKEFIKGIFCGCSYLEKISVPSSIVKIGNFAFLRCVALKDVEFDEGSQLDSIGKYAFSYCSSIKKISLPSNVKSIGEKIFNECKNLEEVSLPAALNQKATFEYLGCSPQVKINFY